MTTAPTNGCRCMACEAFRAGWPEPLRQQGCLGAIMSGGLRGFDRYADDLALRVGRPAADLLRDGLTAYDFTRTVTVSCADGSLFFLRYALFARHGDKVAFFTEHVGYFEFVEDEITVLMAAIK